MLTRRLFTAVSIAAICTPALAAKPQVYAARGAAIRGYDPVAYFTERMPVRGSEEFTFDWNGATWRFKNAENRDLFAENPEMYAPQYGGYCAWAVSRGYTARIDPDAWSIYEGKLYLNYSLRIRRQWSADIPGNVVLGDANWPGVLE